MQILVSFFQRTIIFQVPDDQGGLNSVSTRLKPFDDNYEIEISNGRTNPVKKMSKSIASWFSESGYFREDLFTAEIRKFLAEHKIE